MADIIEDGKVVRIHYTLRGDDGEVIDSSEGGAPLPYLHGHQNIVVGLEEALAGASAGQHVDAVDPPAKGYGERQGDGPQAVKRSEFPKDMELHVGMPIRAEDGEGNVVMLWISKVEGAWVHLDLNHPMAGQTLHFSVDVVDIRDASDVEIAHGHVHGPGGHHH